VPHERGVCFGSLRCWAPRTVEETALWHLSVLRRLGPSSSRGSSWLGGLFWGRVSRSLLRVRPLYGVINGHVCKRRGERLPPAVAISLVAAAIIDVLPVPGGSSTAEKPYGGRDSARSTPPSAAGPCPSLPRGGLGSREGFAPRRLRRDSVNVRLFSSRMRSAESLLLNPPDSRYQWEIDNSLWV
jgi:hypothetical protein